MTIKLSDEQKKFIQLSKTGKNILVDACIGSGKTTSIQALCNELPDKTRILYLTYNKLLKLDAKRKIKKPNITVTNYHGFAAMALYHNGMQAPLNELISTVVKKRPPMPHYDILILDEYQDIEQEISELLEYIQSYNPNIQIIAVGDMEQKIYDKTTLNVREFMEGFMGTKHLTMNFTKCFRLSKDYAAKLGDIWNKKIVGVNPDCKIEDMNYEDALDFLSMQEPQDVMCLGSRTGDMSKALNFLEDRYAKKYNKNTVYASISSNNSGYVYPKPTSAIFTTFDSCKGLEKNTCIVFDFTESYWDSRINKPMQRYAILRNIFLVAASRGKHHIIFVRKNNPLVSDETLSTPTDMEYNFENTSMSGLFEFKYREDIEQAYNLLNVEYHQPPMDEEYQIPINTNDGLIDLAPCIHYDILKSYFKDYDLDSSIDLVCQRRFNRHISNYERQLSNERKVLELIALITYQDRYRNQVKLPILNMTQNKMLKARLSTLFNETDETQYSTRLTFMAHGKAVFSASDYIDVMYGNIPYEIVYKDGISHEDCLSIACKVLGSNNEKGMVWNLYDNTKALVTIKDDEKFLNQVAKTATKGYLKEYQTYE